MLFGSLIDSPSFYKLFDDFEGVLILWNFVELLLVRIIGLPHYDFAKIEHV